MDKMVTLVRDNQQFIMMILAIMLGLKVISYITKPIFKLIGIALVIGFVYVIATYCM